MGFALLRSLTLALLVVPSAAWAAGNASYKFTKDNNKVEWVAVGNPGFLRINGTGGAAEGTLTVDKDKVSGQLNVPLKAFETGIETRDEHMHEKYLETPKFPKASLVLKDVPFNKGGEFAWTGTLTIKKDSKPVKGKASVQGKEIKASFKVNINDYPSIGVPKYLGVTMANEVEVTMEASL